MVHRNLPLKAASLVLAVFLWFWVMLNEENPITNKMVELRLTVHGVAAGLAARPQARRVRASLRGLEQDMDDLQNRALASVSCRGLGEGRHRLAVRVQPPADVSVIAVRPASVVVVMEKAPLRRAPGRGRPATPPRAD